MNNFILYQFMILTHSTLQTKTDTCANSEDPDETARDEPSHPDLHCLPLSETPICINECCPNSEMEYSMSETRG